MHDLRMFDCETRPQCFGDPDVCKACPQSLPYKSVMPVAVEHVILLLIQ